MSNLKSEYLKEAMATMDRVLMPQTEEGLIEPIEFPDAAPQKMLYPYFKRNADGMISPIIFAEEFANGNMPDYLEYKPGWQLPAPEVAGLFPLQNIVYEDPRLNLETDDWKVLNGQEREKTSSKCKDEAMQQAEKFALLPKRRYYMEGNIAECCDAGILFMTEDGEEQICNFDILVKEHLIIKERNKKDGMEFLFEVICNNTRKELTISNRDVDNITKIVQREVPICTLNTTVSKCNLILASIVRKQIQGLPVRYIFKSPGFWRVEEGWVYAHDTAPTPNPKTVFQTGYSILYDPSLSPTQACVEAKAFLNLSQKQTMLLPLFLLAHLGPMFELFADAGYVPRFVTFLNGRTGSLKTSMALCLYRIFSELKDTPEANFNDTETALEIKLGTAYSRVLLVDDFRPPVTAAAGRQNLEKLEKIIRFVGDRISKARSNPELGRAKEFPPTGCCLITGEDTGGSQSSLLRCLVLPIEKGDINGKELQKYQDNPLLLQTHMYHFLCFCGEHGDQFVRHIKENFKKERDYFSSRVHERRIADTGATLVLVAHIFLCYAASVGAVTESGIRTLEQEWRAIITQALHFSEDYSKEKNPCAMYLGALFDMYQSGRVAIASEISTYEPTKHIGYAKDGEWWLRKNDLYRLVVQYWGGLGVTFPLSIVKVNEALDDQGLIGVSYQVSDGVEKKLYSKRSSLEGRPHMTVLFTSKAQEYLQRELGEY